MSTALMAPRKNNKRNKAGMAIAKAIIDEYQPKNAEEMQDALKEIFGPMFEAMLQGEMDSHLGYALYGITEFHRDLSRTQNPPSKGFRAHSVTTPFCSITLA